MMEQTLVKIKPDAYKNGSAGAIIAHLEKKGFTIRAMKLTQLTTEQARQFYAVHKERPFFNDLVAFITSGPVVPMVLEIEGNAVTKAREVIGATDPAEAADDTIRKLFGTDKEKNAIHGSDSKENAALEIAFYFSQREMI